MVYSDDFLHLDMAQVVTLVWSGYHMDGTHVDMCLTALKVTDFSVVSQP